jgi:hypothetical protein
MKNNLQQKESKYIIVNNMNVLPLRNNTYNKHHVWYSGSVLNALELILS